MRKAGEDEDWKKKKTRDRGGWKRLSDNNNNNKYNFYSALGGPSSEAQQNKIVNQIQEPGTYRGRHQYEGPPTI